MFLHRLKFEFAANFKLLIAIWVVFGIIVWSFHQWWFSPLVDQDGADGAVSVIGIILLLILVLCLVSTLFKRDDLKHPQEFWVTRPIRSFTFFGAKLVFAWLVIALPCAVLITLIGMITGVGLSALWNGLEMMLWVSLVTNLLAMSCMANPGNRSLYGFLCFIGGVILTCILMNNAPLDRLLNSYGVSDRQMSWNFFILLIVLNMWFGWKCLQLIRDKHTNQRALYLGVIGVLTVLVIAFVAIPGGLSRGMPNSPAKHLTTVTKKVSQTISYTVGEKYGAKFASFAFEVNAGESIPDFDCEIVDTDLVVIGQDNTLLEMQMLMNRYQDYESQTLRTNLNLNFSVFDRLPGIGGSSSSGNDSRIEEIIDGIPLQKVRIQGTVTLNQLVYRELVSGPLDQPFVHREGGIVCAYNPVSMRGAYNTSWKAFSPPSTLSAGNRVWEKVRIRLEAKSHPSFQWTRPLIGGSMSSGTFFGSYHLQHIRIGDADIESDYIWQQLKRGGYDKSVKEWKKDARLVFEVVHRVTPLIIPVDVEVEVPDPSKVRELLKNGTL